MIPINAFGIIRKYKKIKSNIELYKNNLEILQLYLENFDAEGELLNAQILNDMPIQSGGVNSKIEKVCIKKEDIEEKALQLKIKLKSEQAKINYADMKLLELNDKERYIITSIYLEFKSNQVTLAEMTAKYEMYISIRKYHYIKKNAINKLNLH